MKTTILLCTYNGELFLQKQLDSYLSQTKKVDHIYIADDQSSDGTMGILRNFQSTAPCEVTLVQNATRLGYSKNFLTHFQKTDGDLVFLSDQDDIWWPNKIEEFYKVFDKDPYLALCFSNAELIDEHDNVINRDYFSFLKMMDKWDNVNSDLVNYFIKNSTFVNGCFMALSAKVRKKTIEFFEAYPNYDEDIGHDQFLSLLVGLSFTDDFVREVLKVLIRHRKHNQQTKGVEFGEINPTIEQKVGDKRENKSHHIAYHKTHLERLLGLAILVDKNHNKKKKIEAAISFYNQRLNNTKRSKLSQLLFTSSRFITGKYHKYAQSPVKELIRDLL